MIFVKNLKFLPNLIFFAQGLGMMFDDVLDRKEDFIDYKNATLSQSKNEHFSWRGLIMISVKNLKFPLTFFKDLDMTLHDVLERKEGFLDYKKVILT